MKSDKDRVADALRRSLEYLPPNHVCFRLDGAPITVARMLEMIQGGDPAADNFIDDVVGAAVGILRLRHQKKDQVMP